MTRAPGLRHFYREVNGLRVFARAGGPADTGRLPVVLVHGLSVSSRYMVPTAKRLASEFQVYAPDLPGYGHSQKPDRILNISQLTDSLVRWMEGMGIERADLLGNSMGCQLIIDLALRYPGCIRRAVLTGPTIDPRAPGDLQQIARGLRTMLHEPLSLVPILIRDYLYAGVRRTFVTLDDAEEDPIRKKLARVPNPVLVARGQWDSIVPHDWAQEVARLLPRGRLITVPGGAHAIIYDASDRLVPAVTAFLLEPDTDKPIN